MTPENLKVEYFASLGFFKLFVEFEPTYWIFILFGVSAIAMFSMPKPDKKRLALSAAIVLSVLFFSFFNSAVSAFNYKDSYLYCKNEKISSSNINSYVKRCLESYAVKNYLLNYKLRPAYLLYSFSENRINSEKLTKKPYDLQFVETLAKIPSIGKHNLNYKHINFKTYRASVLEDLELKSKRLSRLEASSSLILSEVIGQLSTESYILENSFKLKNFNSEYKSVEKDSIYVNNMLDEASANCNSAERLPSCISIEHAVNAYNARSKKLLSDDKVKKVLRLIIL